MRLQKRVVFFLLLAFNIPFYAHTHQADTTKAISHSLRIGELNTTSTVNPCSTTILPCWTTTDMGIIENATPATGTADSCGPKVYHLNINPGATQLILKLEKTSFFECENRKPKLDVIFDSSDQLTLSTGNQTQDSIANPSQGEWLLHIKSTYSRVGFRLTVTILHEEFTTSQATSSSTTSQSISNSTTPESSYELDPILLSGLTIGAVGAVVVVAVVMIRRR
jgi:hypothetical protein